MQSTDQSASFAPAGTTSAGSDPKAKASAVAGEAQEKAQQAAGQLQDRVREQIDQRSGQAADQISEQASDLRAVAESLREQDKAGAAKAAEQLAGYAEKVSAYLNEKDSRALLADVERVGRRQPWAAAAGGLAVGFAASRFLKASSSERYRGHLTVARPAGVYPAADAPNGNGMSGRSQAGPSGLGSGPVM